MTQSAELRICKWSSSPTGRVKCLILIFTKKALGLVVNELFPADGTCVEAKSVAYKSCRVQDVELVNPEIQVSGLTAVIGNSCSKCC